MVYIIDFLFRKTYGKTVDLCEILLRIKQCLFLSHAAGIAELLRFAKLIRQLGAIRKIAKTTIYRRNSMQNSLALNTSAMLSSLPL